MMKSLASVFIAVIVVVTSISCATNALTNKPQLSLVSDNEVLTTSDQQYKQFISSNRVIKADGANKSAVMVNKVGNKIIAAVNEYYMSIGKTEELKNYSWEINTVDSKEVNAWCMPGGKIVVYTGILPVTQNEASLAVVLGHEVTHALAKHGNERMSQGLLQQFGGQALSIAFANKPQQTQQLFATAYGVGTQYGIMLPFGRKDEYEADRYGLIFTALAGYDPREAVNFWNRMKTANNGKTQPEFLSTHPNDDNRIAQLQSIMDETIAKYYRPGK